MTYKVVNSAGNTLVLSGGTRLDKFKTEKEARECLESYHQKAIGD